MAAGCSTGFIKVVSTSQSTSLMIKRMCNTCLWGQTALQSLVWPVIQTNRTCAMHLWLRILTALSNTGMPLPANFSSKKSIFFTIQYDEMLQTCEISPLAVTTPSRDSWAEFYKISKKSEHSLMQNREKKQNCKKKQ